MKKFYIASLAALGLALGACSDEFGAPTAGNEGMVTITAQLPADMASRAFADGTGATTLSYAVYEAGTKNVIFTSETATDPQAMAAGDLAFTLSLNLVKGQTYDFVFWADAEGAPYTFTPSTQSVSISYEGIEGNDEGRDAFFNAVKGLTVTGAMSKCVQLRRPFAQLNIGTDDIDVAAAASVNHKYTTVTVSGVYSELNLFSGVASVPVEGGVTFAAHEANSEAFPVAHADAGKEYKYLSMNYILTGSVIPDTNINEAQKETKDVVIALADDAAQINEFKLSAVPFQRNYRTNIYGSLLTSQVDLTIDIVPGFDTPDHEMYISTPEDFLGKLADPDVPEMTIAPNTELDLTDATPEQLTSNSPKTITLNGGSSIILAPEKVLTANDDLTIIGPEAARGVRSRAAEVAGDINMEGGIISNVGIEAGPNNYKSLIHIKSGTLTLKNMKLINDPDHHWHSSNSATAPYNSTAIAYWNDANIVIEDSYILSGEFTVCGMGRGVASGTVTLTNSYFESTSSVSHNGKHWAYAMRLFGSKGTINNCEVKGIQGAVSAEEIDLTINGGKYYTVNTPGKTDAFYAVYVTNRAKVTILDGEFLGANAHSKLAEGTSTVVCGDNDTNMELGNVVIKGGKFGGKAYNHVTNTVYQPEEWIALDADQAPYKWTVSTIE